MHVYITWVCVHVCTHLHCTYHLLQEITGLFILKFNRKNRSSNRGRTGDLHCYVSEVSGTQAIDGTWKGTIAETPHYSVGPDFVLSCCSLFLSPFHELWCPAATVHYKFTSSRTCTCTWVHAHAHTHAHGYMHMHTHMHMHMGTCTYHCLKSSANQLWLIPVWCASGKCTLGYPVDSRKQHSDRAGKRTKRAPYNLSSVSTPRRYCVLSVTAHDVM